MAKKRRKEPRGAARPRIKNSGYSEGGASETSSILKAWHPLKLSSKSDIDRHLHTLRNRAADEAINTPIGAAAITSSATHAVGTGLTLFPRPKFKQLGISADEARVWIRRTMAEFGMWADSKQCDIYRRNNFYDLQYIAYISYLIDGDAFALFRRKAPDALMPYSLRLQLLEANRISNPLSSGLAVPFNVEMHAPTAGHRIVSGVEIDADGAIAGYWVSNKVPYDRVDTQGPAQWIRVEAFGRETGLPNILQICHDIRADQYRGVPYLAPVIETLKQVSRFTTAELASAIVKSFFSLFFTQTATGGDLNAILGGSFEGDPNAPVVDVGEYALGPGTLNALPSGVDVKSVDASNAQSVFGVFTQELVKQIGAALGQPYEVLMKNFTSSYSASRAALLQAWDEYKMRRVWFARDFCQPVYEVWLAEAIAIGRIEAPGFFDNPTMRRAWSNAEWFGPTMSILDPVKDVTGSNLRVAYGLSTREREAAEMTGSDYEENIEQLAYEQNMMTKLGLEEATKFA
ncbi:phage portal protein [Selenomonas sp. F0473]|uniref:phage portal protein n=1 Tax=Selenomonas sp. F0473 TaxID=999423 RepID=UPI0025E94455|nr:phage portal protein [Selenomonas sp. F0473]